jgi:transposase-like protein
MNVEGQYSAKERIMRERQRREYTPDERAAAMAALDANSGNVGRTATQLGIPEPTLRGWTKRPESPPLRALHEQKRNDLAGSLDRLAWRLVREARSKDKIKGASLSQVMVAFGIAVDKAALLRQSTSIPPKAVSIAGGFDFAKLTAAELEQFLAALKKMENGSVAEPGDNGAAVLRLSAAG